MTYLGEILQAIHEDGLPIEGIFAWGKGLFCVVVGAAG